MSEEKIKQPENWEIAYREFKERQSIDDKFEVNSLCFIYGFHMGFKEKPPVTPSLQSGVEDAAKEYCKDIKHPYNFNLHQQREECFKAGAEWQAQQVKPAIPWISIKDSLPKDHTYVIGYYWNGRDIYEFKHGCFFIGLEQNKEVTHWMPLPEPPIQ